MCSNYVKQLTLYDNHMDTEDCIMKPLNQKDIQETIEVVKDYKTLESASIFYLIPYLRNCKKKCGKKEEEYEDIY